MKEKKAQQKRKFKEALQNKRQQSSDSDNEIQKVIDEMYANQAKQYTGESSLDHEENNDDERTTHTEDSTDKMEDTNENTTDNHVIDEGTQTDSNTSNYDDDDEQYQYEEIDLKSVPNIQTVNDKDVEIREVNDTTSTDEHNDDQLSDNNLNVAPIHSTKDKHHHFNKNEDAHLSKVNKLQEDNYTSKEKVEEAKYHEMNVSSNEDITKQSNHNDDDIDHSIDNAIETDTEYASEQVEHNNDSVHDSSSNTEGKN